MLVENDITNFSQLKEELLKEIRISENKILDTIKKQTQEIKKVKIKVQIKIQYFYYRTFFQIFLIKNL